MHLLGIYRFQSKAKLMRGVETSFRCHTKVHIQFLLIVHRHQPVLKKAGVYGTVCVCEPACRCHIVYAGKTDLGRLARLHIEDMELCVKVPSAVVPVVEHHGEIVKIAVVHIAKGSMLDASVTDLHI